MTLLKIRYYKHLTILSNFSVTISDFSNMDINEHDLEVDDADNGTPYVTLEDVERFKMKKCESFMREAKMVSRKIKDI